MNKVDGEHDSPQRPDAPEIAKRVLTFAAGTIASISVLTLAGAAIAGPRTFASKSLNVFSVLLPLLGTWVGTVLAYYFSRQNFENAADALPACVGAQSAKPGRIHGCLAAPLAPTANDLGITMIPHAHPTSKTDSIPSKSTHIHLQPRA
jgi:hypothetical protein